MTALSGAGLALTLAGCGGGSRAGDGLRMMWWGDAARQRLMDEAIDRFARQNGDLKITREAAPWSGYWNKLATQMAGRSAPDWIMMDQSYLGEYAQRHGLADLGPFVGKSLDIAALPKDLVDSARIEGKLFVVPLALNTQILLHNASALRSVGVELPEQASWEEFAAFAKAVSKASRGTLVGTPNMGFDTGTLEVWLRSRGRELYTAEGAGLACSADDLAAWWSYWIDLQRAGATVTPAQQAASNAGSDADDVLVKRLAAVTFNWSPQWQNFQELVKDEIGGGPLPVGPEGSGQFVKAASYYCSPATSKNLERATRLASFFVNDRDTARSLGLTLGVPATATGREAVADHAAGTAKASITYVDSVQRTARPQARPWPRGAGQVMDAFKRAHEDLSFGRISLDKAVERALSESDEALRR